MLDLSLSTSESVIQALILATVAIAVVTDVQRRKIYNALTFPVMLLGLVANTVADGPGGLLRSASGLLLGAALFLIPVAFMHRGAGDLKLLAAVGALGGSGFVFWCALWTGVFGALFAVVVLLWKRRFTMVAGGMAFEAMSGQLPRATSNIRLPYAVPIALGAVAALALS